MSDATDEPAWSDPGRSLSPDHQRAVIEALRAILPADSVLSQESELRPYECDGLAAYRQTPMVVALPENEAPYWMR